MKPVRPDHVKSRVTLYFFGALVTVVVLLALGAIVALLFYFFAGAQAPPFAAADGFARLMNIGKSYYEQGDATNAVEAFRKAVALQPTDPDPLLNLANACLLADQSENALKFALIRACSPVAVKSEMGPVIDCSNLKVDAESMRWAIALSRATVLAMEQAAKDEIAHSPFALRVNRPDGIHFSYARYLAKSLRLALGLAGTPIRLSLRRGTPRARTRPGTRKAAR